MIRIDITAAKNSGNATVFSIVDSEDNPVNLTALGATVVTVEVCVIGCSSSKIDSDSDDVSFVNDTVSVKFGKLDAPASRVKQAYAPKISYVTAVNPEPEVIAGEGFATEIRLRVIC